jgi:c-di-GMP phosphodiesterase
MISDSRTDPICGGTVNRKRILIVDDIPLMRQLLKKYIEKIGRGLADGPAACQFELLEAGNGQEALDLLSRNRGSVDLIFLDLMMPECDGLTFLERRRSDAEINRVPVVLTTALGEESTIQKAVSLGAAAYIRKPFTSQGFEAVFRKFIGIA